MEAQEAAPPSQGPSVTVRFIALLELACEATVSLEPWEPSVTVPCVLVERDYRMGVPQGGMRACWWGHEASTVEARGLPSPTRSLDTTLPSM